MKPAHTPGLNWLAAAALAAALVACPEPQTPPPAPDTTPNPVTFVPVSGAELSAVIESNQVTISGISTTVTVSVSGGEYRIGDAGTYTGAPGTISAGDKLQLRTTAAATLNTANDVQVTVGTSTFSFGVTTKTTPGDVRFTSKIDQPWGTAVESNTVTLSSINPSTPISVSGAGGSYKINSGTYTTTAGIVNSGDAVTVKGNTASADLTDTVITLTIGTQARSFTLRTGKRIPDAFTPALTNQTNAVPGSSIARTFTVSGITIPSPIAVAGGSFTVNGAARTSPSTVNNDDVVVLTATAPSTADGSSSAPVSVTIGRDGLNPSGGLAGSFTVSTADWIPNAFTLTLDMTQTNVDGTGKVVPSQYLAERLWTGQGRYDLPGCDNNSGLSGDDRYACPRIPPTAIAGTGTNANNLLENIDRVRFYSAQNVTVNGISTNTPISITGGQYRIGNGAFTTSAGTINPGDNLTVQVQAGYFPGVTTTAVVSFGTAPYATTRSLSSKTNKTVINLTPDVWPNPTPAGNNGGKFLNDPLKMLWTANPVTTPVVVSVGSPTSATITIPTTDATISRVRVLVTLNGASVRPSDDLIRLFAPNGTSYTLMDFVNSKPAGSGLPAGVNPIDPRLAGSPPSPVNVPLVSGTVSQLPWPWQGINYNLADGGWGSGGIDTIFDSANFGLNGVTATNNYEVGTGTDTYLDGGINRNDVYRRCGQDSLAYNKAAYKAAELNPSLTPTDITNLNASLNRDLPRKGAIDPYTNKADNRTVVGGEYTEGQCKRRDNATWYPPVAPDARVGNLTALSGINPSGAWRLEITDNQGVTPVSLTSFKLIFDFTP